MGGIWNGSKHGGESRVGCEGSVGRHATGCSQANPPYMASWAQQHMHQLDLFQLSAKFGVIGNNGFAIRRPSFTLLLHIPLAL